MSGRREQSNILPTDEEPLASLLNPGCGIPFDVYFAIEDEEGGTLLGLLGGHKNLMALKSPVFKTMFYGSMKENDPVQIKATSLGAFKEMLKYIHEGAEAENDWRKMDIREVIKIADLAERYHLPGLMSRTVDFATSYQFPKKHLIETFCLAESVPFLEFSKALLKNCDEFLLTILATPKDYDNFVKENAQESAALRLLARVEHDKMAFVDTRSSSVLMQEAVACIRKIKREIRPRYHLLKLLVITRKVEEENTWNSVDCCWEADPDVPNFEEYRDLILSLTDSHFVTVNSLRNAMKADTEAAGEEGTPLTWETEVKDSGDSETFTHEQSVKLHLDLMNIIRHEKPQEWKGSWTWKCMSVIWGLIVSSTTVPEAKEHLFEWLSENFLYLNKETRTKLVETFSLCPDAYKRSPGSKRFYDTCVKYANYDSDDNGCN